MPDPTLSDAAREAYASVPADEVVLHTLEIRHSSFVAPIRVVANYADSTSWSGWPEAQAVLDGMTAAARDLVGLVAQLEGGAPEDAATWVPFTAVAFNFEEPEVDSVPVPEATLSIDNVDRAITDALMLAATSQEKTDVIYRGFLATDPTQPVNNPPLLLTLSDAEAGALQVTGRARMVDLGAKAFPAVTYTTRRYPGLKR